MVCGDTLLNEAMKPSKLIRHLESKHPTLKDKPLDFFERKKREQESQKIVLKTTTSVNVAGSISVQNTSIFFLFAHL